MVESEESGDVNRQHSKRVRTRLPKDTLLNVNLPRVLPDKSIKITRVGIRRYRDFVEKRLDLGDNHYWLTGEGIDLEEGLTQIQGQSRTVGSPSPQFAFS